MPLLTREGEVAIAKRIERGQLSVRKIFSRSPIVVHELARLGVAIEDRERSIRKIVTFNKDELTAQGIEKCRQRVLGHDCRDRQALQADGAAPQEARRHLSEKKAPGVPEGELGTCAGPDPGFR